MDFRKYEVFLRTLECGSLTRAGEELGYTQSGVSHMMKSLEEEVGFCLFSRGRAGVELTAEGARIVPIIRELSKWNEQLSQVLSSIKGFELGTIRIATIASISFHWEIQPTVRASAKIGVNSEVGKPIASRMMPE